MVSRVNQVSISHGILARAGDMKFHAWYVEPGENDEPPIANIVALVGDDEHEFTLREGDTFEVGGEVWKVAEIKWPHTKRWGVLLTRETSAD